MAFQILYVEDDPLDVQLMREAFKSCAIPYALTIATNGRAALDVVRAGRLASPAWIPDVIVCDLHMPEMNGHEFLRCMKEEPTQRHIPVIMLSATRSENEVALCYELHANCVVRKPTSFEALQTIVVAMSEFWLTTAVRAQSEA